MDQQVLAIGSICETIDFSGFFLFCFSCFHNLHIMSIVTLNCLITGDIVFDVFKVNIEKNETVDGLTKAIKKVQEHVDDIKLWKVNVPLDHKNNKLASLMNDPIADVKDMFGGIKLSIRNNIRNILYSRLGEKCIDIIAEPYISFKICTKKKELVPGDVVILDSAEGVINFTDEGPKICYNNGFYKSFKEFIQEVSIGTPIQISNKPSRIRGRNLKESLMVCKNLVLLFNLY